jgi:2-isopropylmalate synthase
LLKNRSTYEIMDPDRMGIPRSMIVLGKHSGRHALKHRLEQYGIEAADEELNHFTERFKEEADSRKYISDSDLLRIWGDTADTQAERYSMTDFQVISNHRKIKVASVTLKDNRTGEEHSYAAAGAGPVEAVVACIKQAVPMQVELKDMEIHSLSSTESAQGEAQVTVEVGGELFRGSGIDRDILSAVAQAFLSAVNQAVCRMHDCVTDEAAG